ncbi:MAG: glycosyltransferase [Oceanicaulis sp.]|nr:glycosyltransferase [Oceanicaulis sp.]
MKDPAAHAGTILAARQLFEPMKDVHSQMTQHSMDAASLEQQYQELLGKLPSRAPIYLPTDKIPLEDKIRGVRHVIQIYKQDLDAVYRPRLRELREQFKGRKRCFLIGNGPSLNETDLAVLKDEVTFAVNGFFLKAKDLDWKPTFYLVEDHLVAEDRAPWINEFKGPIKLFPAYLGYMFEASEDTVFYNHRPRKSYPHGFDFSMEADKITYTGCTVTFSMMQIAAYLGFEEIYLIGVDASYAIPDDAKESKDYGVGVLDMKSDDPNHFDPDYFGKGFRWHDPQVDKMVEAYTEARRTLEGTGQMIYNAGIGGQLEVFERRPFHDLFPNARSPEDVKANGHKRLYPRLLLLDMTPFANGTATGEIKANLFAGWPEDQLLQVARHGKEGLALSRPDGSGGYVTKPCSEEAARTAALSFDADVVLYRLVPDVPWLHTLAMSLLSEIGKPVVAWVMDDWPRDLAERDPEQWRALEPDLKVLLERAASRLSICQAMSTAFEARYGASFIPLANGVRVSDWPDRAPHTGRRLRIRYAGGLAANMQRASVLRLARAVERLGKAGNAISLEINTQPNWLREAKDDFTGFEFTSVTDEKRPLDVYREWLRRADAVVVAYNFDEATLRYVRYSMANKMPECLASGAVLLAHGPSDAATIGYLKDNRLGVVIDEEDEVALERALLDLLNDPDQRQALGDAARQFAFKHHNLEDLHETLRQIIHDAAQGATISVPPPVSRTAAETAPPPRAGGVHLPDKASTLVQEPVRRAGPSVRGQSLVTRSTEARAGQSVILYPDLSSTEALSDQYFRALWYLYPLRDKIGRIIIPVRGALGPIKIPEYLDPRLEQLQDTIPVEFLEVEGLADPGYGSALQQADHVVVWSVDPAAPNAQIPALAGKSCIRVDPVRLRNSGSFYLKFAEQFSELQTDYLKRSRKVFARVAERCASKVGYIFGTGPNLSHASAHDFSDGVTIACNSMVRNRELMDRLQPRLIVAADPIFHAGPSSYAGAFREQLIDALDRYSADLVVPLRDYHIYSHHLPERFADRIVGVPLETGDRPNIDLSEQLKTTSTANVLTLFLLPLATTFFEEIRIFGCDGRPLSEDNYFWKHDKSSQFNEQMTEIQKAHPAFFEIDYNDYYLAHCKTLETWLSTGEAAGKRFTNHTPSYIPALLKRSTTEALSFDPEPVFPEALASRVRKVISIDPDARDHMGHYLAYDIRLAEASARSGTAFAIAGNKALETKYLPESCNEFIPTFSVNSWSVGNKPQGAEPELVARFDQEMQHFIETLPAQPDGGLTVLYMYCGSIDHANIIHNYTKNRPDILVHINLFWSFSFDESDPAYIAKWEPFIQEVEANPQIVLTMPTEGLRTGFARSFGVFLPVAPHPSTTFSDAEARALSKAAPHNAPHEPTVLFPGAMRPEKGFPLTAKVASRLLERQKVKCIVRGSSGRTTPRDMLPVLKQLNESGVTIVTQHLSDEEFPEFLQTGDLIVCPYRPPDFSRRTSGLIIDSMLLCIPVVVLENTWLAEFVEHSQIGVVSADDPEAMIQSIDQALKNFEVLSRNCAKARVKYLEQHSWDSLLRFIVGVSAGPYYPSRDRPSNYIRMNPVHSVSGPVDSSTAPHRPARPGAAPAKLAANAQSASEPGQEPVRHAGPSELRPPQPPLVRPWYAPVGDAVRRVAPGLFPVLQAARRTLWRSGRSAVVLLAGAGAIAAVAFAILGPGPLGARLLLGGVVLGAIALLGVGALGWRLRRAVQTLSAENRRLAADIARIHELAADREQRVDNLVNHHRDFDNRLVKFGDAQSRGVRTFEDRLSALSDEHSRTVHALKDEISRTGAALKSEVSRSGKAARADTVAALSAQLQQLEAQQARLEAGQAGAFDALKSEIARAAEAARTGAEDTLRTELARLEAEQARVAEVLKADIDQVGKATLSASEAALRGELSALEARLTEDNSEKAAAFREELTSLQAALEQKISARTADATHSFDQAAQAARQREAELREQIAALQQALKRTEEETLAGQAVARAGHEALSEEIKAVRQGLEQRLHAEVNEATTQSLSQLSGRLEAAARAASDGDTSLREELNALRALVNDDVKTPLEALKTTSKQALEIATGVQKTTGAFRKTGTMLQSRVAAAERQIGAIKYPDAPDVFVLFGHHKCGSRFFRNEVFGRIAESTGARVRQYKIDNPPHHYSRLDDLDLPNIDFSRLGENGRDVVLFANATQRSLDKIRRTAGDDWRGLRIIRDPRQVLISSYFHHKGNHHTELNGWVWDQLKQDKPILNELSKEEGILYELDNISRHVIEDLVLAPFDDERVLTLKLEDFAADPATHLEQIAHFLKVPDIAGIDLGSTNANPESGPWAQNFTSKIREVFKERYGQALIDLGYEEDMDW